MTLQDLITVLRVRKITVLVTTLAVTLVVTALTLLTTPLYQATTRLFVSASDGSTLAETYQGNRFSQERVISYTELISGETLAQRTIDKLGLNVTAPELQEHIEASAKPGTVLITVNVLDQSPVQARDIANVLSDEFVELVRELETPEDGSRPDSRVVVEQRASIPQTPVVPKKAKQIGIGFALGLVLGIAVAFVRNMLDTTIKDRQKLESVTGVGVVGTIPLDKERRSSAAISFASDNSAIAESFRKLRTNLQFLSVDDPPKVIVVTSSVPSEGKSTTAINIALALAEADHKVVLVDGDLRRPSLHKYLGLIGTVGLSTVLSGSSSLDDALQPSSEPRLQVLASGKIPPNPSEILASQATRNLLADLKERFDYVVVDSAPLLAVTDAAILSAAADGALLITRFGQPKREQVGHAVEALDAVGARLLGSVFTITPSRKNGADYYTYYGESTTGGSSRKRSVTTQSAAMHGESAARPQKD